jgi:excisionase family DNA binding protein
LQPDATDLKPAESLPGQHPTERPVLSVDATKCSPATDAGLTPIRASPAGFLDSISDDRLFTVAQVAELLQIRKTDVYAACDRGQLAYVKFEDAVKIEGRDLKAWARASLP